MASPGQLTTAVSEVLGLPEPTVAYLYRLLREQGTVSKNGRGRAATTVSAKDASALLIAALGQLPLKPRLVAWETFAAAKPDQGWCEREWPRWAVRPAVGAWSEIASCFPVLAALGPEHTLHEAIAALIEEASRAPLLATLARELGPDEPARAAPFISLDFQSPLATAALSISVGRIPSPEEIGERHLSASELMIKAVRLYMLRAPSEGGVEADSQPLPDLTESRVIHAPTFQALGDLIAGRAP